MLRCEIQHSIPLKKTNDCESWLQISTCEEFWFFVFLVFLDILVYFQVTFVNFILIPLYF